MHIRKRFQLYILVSDILRTKKASNGNVIGNKHYKMKSRKYNYFNIFIYNRKSIHH